MTDLPTLQELKCLYCRDAINHTKEECGDVISKKEVVKLLKAHAAALFKEAEVQLSRFAPRKAVDAMNARDVVLELAGLTVEDLK